jgi:hypothetical protein
MKGKWECVAESWAVGEAERGREKRREEENSCCDWQFERLHSTGERQAKPLHRAGAGAQKQQKQGTGGRPRGVVQGESCSG